MKNKFEIEDYFNYIISGFLWILFFTLSINEFFSLSNLLNYNIYGIGPFLILIIVSYVAGNVLRPCDYIISKLADFIWGDFYEQALLMDKNTYRRILRRYCFCKFYAFCKPSSIEKEKSEQIVEELKKLKLFSENYKKSQFIMAEDYLIFNYDYRKLKFHRLKNLKNLFESISIPLFLLTCFWNYKLFSYKYSILFLSISLSLIIVFIKRYKYLKSNYIKDVYRYFIFHNS